jgi:hypothetical protein
VASSNALLLRDVDRIRFVPDARNADAASFDLHAWDRTAGVAGGKVNATVTGGVSAFSSGKNTASISVAAVNDAPVLGSAAMGTVFENDLDPPGASVGTLFAGRFSDVDAGAGLAGVAIVGNAAPAAEGIWQYSSDGGASWFAVGGVNDGANALALSTAARLRFLPALDFTGTPTSLVLRGLDDSYAGAFSSTAAGVESRVSVNTGANGGTSAIAGATATLSTSVSDVIDPPPDPDPPAEEAPPPDPVELPEEPAPDPTSELPPPVDQPDAAGGVPVVRTGVEISSHSDGPGLAESARVTRREVRRLEGPRPHATPLEAFKALVSEGFSFLDTQTGFTGELDRMREDLLVRPLLAQPLIGSSVSLTAGLSIGYLVWLARGGLLIASFASSMPAWRLIDPIPVLARLGADGDSDAGDDESLESLLDIGEDEPEGEPEHDAEEGGEVSSHP